jgi:hypothetical protein
MLAAVAFPAIAEAQAWTRDMGSGYVNLTFTGLTSSRLYNPDFSKQDLPTTYTQYVLGLYGDVGIIDRWLTLAVSSELFRRNQLSEQGATYGLGDSKIGLYTGILDEPFRLTFGVDVGLPTGDHRPSAGDGADAEGELIARSLPTGDGEVDIEPRLLVGYSFGGDVWPLRHFVSASIGYAFRTSAKVDGVRQGFADAFTYGLEVGTQIPVFILDRIWFSIRFFGVESFASDQEAATGAVGIGNGVTFTSLGFGVHAKIIGGFGVLFNVETAFRARSIVAAVPIRGGLFYEF